ncbi:proline-rich protein 12 [Diachasma alloeum]|uniref:proline-rich protein 12 n=1 Tax=Diachasma alloeum TaxID=454923 RepID=UPI0007383D78|nr:proline-rich protein 12 [Diachasma alloeum]
MKIIEGGILLFAVITAASATFGTINVECPPAVARGIGVKATSIGIKPQYFVSSSVINAESQRSGSVAGTRKSGLGLGPDGVIAPIFPPIGDLCFPLANSQTDNKRPVVYPARAVIPIQPGQVLSFDGNPSDVSICRAKNYGGYPIYPAGYSPLPGGYSPNYAGGYPPNYVGGYPPKYAGGYLPNYAGGYPPNYAGGSSPDKYGEGSGPNNYLGGSGLDNHGVGYPSSNYGGGYCPNCKGGSGPNNYAGGYCPICKGGNGPNNYGGGKCPICKGSGGPNTSGGGYCPICNGGSGPNPYGGVYYPNYEGGSGPNNYPDNGADSGCPTCSGSSSPAHRYPSSIYGSPQDILIGFQKPGATGQSPAGQFRPAIGFNSGPRGKFMVFSRALNPTQGSGDARGTGGQVPISELDAGAAAPYLSFDDQEKLYNGVVKTTPNARADPVSIALAYKNLLGPLQNLYHSGGKKKGAAESSLYFGPKTIPADGRKEIVEKDFPEEKLHTVDKTIVQLRPEGSTSAQHGPWSSECDDEDVDQGEPLSKGRVSTLTLPDQGSSGASITYSDLGYVPVGTTSDNAESQQPTFNGPTLDERDINLCQISAPPHPHFVHGGVTFETPNNYNVVQGGCSECRGCRDRYDDNSSDAGDDEGEEGSGEDDEGLADICQDIDTLSKHRVKFGKFTGGRLSRLWHSARDPSRLIV